MSELAVYGWYRVLDGKTVEIGAGVWRIVLYSVRMIDEGQWLQLLLVGEPTYEMTLRLPWAADEIDVLRIIAEWLTETDDHTESVISVERVERPAES